MQTNCWARRRNTRRSARTSTSPSPSWPASRRLGHAAARRTARRFTRAPVVRRCQSSINSLAIAAAAASSSEEKPIPEISLLPNFDRRRRGRFFSRRLTLLSFFASFEVYFFADSPFSVAALNLFIRCWVLAFQNRAQTSRQKSRKAWPQKCSVNFNRRSARRQRQGRALRVHASNRSCGGQQLYWKAG